MDESTRGWRQTCGALEEAPCWFDSVTRTNLICVRSSVTGGRRNGLNMTWETIALVMFRKESLNIMLWMLCNRLFYVHEIIKQLNEPDPLYSVMPYVKYRDIHGKSLLCGKLIPGRNVSGTLKLDWLIIWKKYMNILSSFHSLTFCFYIIKYDKWIDTGKLNINS